MKEKVNPLTVQSKNWLADALLKLMQNKNFNDISIKEIAEKAQLDRRTFYRHFSTKEELLAYYIDNLSKEYFSVLFSNQNISIYNITKMYFEFWTRHIHFLTAINNNNLQVLLLNSYNQYMPELYKKINSKRYLNVGQVNYNAAAERFSMEPMSYKYGLNFKIGGFWNILFEWIKDENRTAPDEMARIISDFMENGMFL